MKKYLSLFLSLFLLASCGKVDESSSDSNSNSQSESSSISTTNPIISINLSSGKSIKCELYPDIAPITVNNFLSLVDSKFYEGIIFHRTVRQFVIQGGGFYIENRTVYQKKAETITGEFSQNGIKNNLSHTAGVLSMARLGNDYNSASSQFFICVADCLSLDGGYAAFGKTLDEESLNVAIEMSTVQTTKVGTLTNFPVDPVSIINITREN